MNKVKKNKFVLLAFVSVFLLSATIGNSFMTEAPFEKTTNSDPIDSFPQAGKFYTLAGRTFVWEVIDGKNVTTSHYEEIHKWSVEDVVGDVVFVNRTYVEAYIRPETGGNYIDTYDFDYEIATNRTILSAHLKTMSFATTGFLGSSDELLDEDVGEHTWGWFPTDLRIGAYVLVSWTWDRRFLGDMLYEVVGEEVIEVAGEKQDCWMLHMPPTVTIDGTQGRAETYWVDKDTGIPLKLYTKGWALDESFGWEGEYVLVHTNIDLGPKSTETPSPTYTLAFPSTPGFPEAGKFYTWYYLDDGWYISGATNVTYYNEGLYTFWVVNVTGEEALVQSILWSERICAAEDIEELEATSIRYINYTINVNTREILGISGLIYRVNMTSLTYWMEDRTPLLEGDVGEETYCWLPTNLNVGATVNITWTHDWPDSVDNGTYTVTGEKIINALDKPQACWILYMPPTLSIDGTWNISETYYSDKDVGIPLGMDGKGWAVDGSSAYSTLFQFIDTNVDLTPPFPQPGMFYTLAGRSVGWVTVDSKNITYHDEEIHKWSVQDVVGDVAFVNRTFLDVYICPETGGNYTDTYDFDYEIDINRTILSAYLKEMSFDTTGFQGSNEAPLDEDVGEHTWAWFPTDLQFGAYVLVSWTWDRRFLGDMLYEVVGEEVIEVVGEKQDCWVLHMPPSVTIDGTQGRTETYWVDKDTRIPLKMYAKGWALDGFFGWEGEDVLVNTNIDLGPESTETPSPTYTLEVPTTLGFPKAGKFYTWYALDAGWYMDGATNVTWHADVLISWWIVNATEDEALAHKILWYNDVCEEKGIEELEGLTIRYFSYRLNKTTREILDATGSSYAVNMTALTCIGPVDLTPELADDVGEETICWLPTNLYIGTTVNISWTLDTPVFLDNATYTVVGEEIISALGRPQDCSILYLPPTTSIDESHNWTETYYSDKDTGIILYGLSKGEAVDNTSAFNLLLHPIDSNVDLGPNTYYLTITSTAGGTTSPLPETYNYTEGSSPNVTAIPNPGYSFDYWLLDGEEMTENPITMVIDANHTLKAFFVDDIPPEISVPIQEPPENVTDYQNVTVTVNVTDLGTGVYNVTLWYIIVNNGTSWMPLNMTEISANTYQATIPGYENCTWITYKIIAYDNNGNPAATDDIYGYHYVYHVIPEFPTAIIMPLFMIATLLTIIVYKRKQDRRLQEKG